MMDYVRDYYQEHGNPPSTGQVQHEGLSTILRSRYRNNINDVRIAAGIPAANLRGRKTARGTDTYSPPEHIVRDTLENMSPDQRAELVGQGDIEYGLDPENPLRSDGIIGARTSYDRMGREPTESQKPPFYKGMTDQPAAQIPTENKRPRPIKVTNALLQELFSAEPNGLRAYRVDESLDSYHPGDRLNHKKFGVIHVLSLHPDPEDDMIEVVYVDPEKYRETRDLKGAAMTKRLIVDYKE